MTDSMKFGPEWLRNLSTDSTTNTSIGNSVSSGSGTSSNLNSPSSNNAGSNTCENLTSNAHITGQQRNLFPQFRYGREELLSLFDKNCNLPEILPAYKKLFVDKVQVPLALTPSTDEEIFAQGAVSSVQRPAWIRRSPVGFPSSARGGRGSSSVDRGRMRGKSIYHPIYQRPNAIFDSDDVRSSLTKTERSWAERNGGSEASGAGSGYGSAAASAEWNGTPASSPRKEFSSHSRNLENWRKHRGEDGLGDATSAIVATDGWRGSLSHSSTHRWGRSTSWRDEESVASTNIEGYVGNSSGLTTQRSYSTTSAVVIERSNYTGSISKSASLSTGYSGGSNQISNRQTSSNSTSAGSGRNQWTTASNDTADDLPEWAMENPSDSGGTFDASGAFHGSVEDEPSNESKDYLHSPKDKGASNDEVSSSSPKIVEDADSCPGDEEDSGKSCTEAEAPRSNQEEDTPPSGTETNSVSTDDVQKHIVVPESTHANEDVHEQSESFKEPSFAYSDTSTVENALESNNKIQAEEVPRSSAVTSIPITTATQAQLQTTNSHSDLSDHMQEVADNMVEKLIMDDDSIGSSNTDKTNSNPTRISSTTSSINMANTFVSPAVAAIIKQTAAVQQQVSPNLASVSPSLPTLAGNQKVIPLFGGGIVVDHATMQQHHLQQQQLAAASAAASLHSTVNTASAADLWYYRDPQSKVQGPFNAIEMTEWYRAGYFDENLFVRRVCDTRFRALGELIKLCHGNMPFTNTHLIPVGLENVNMASNSVNTIRQVRDKQHQQVSSFGLNLQQHQEHREELKGNVTAAADTLSAAVKNLINPVDMSHMLNVHFQLLQEQYLRHQEMMIVAEYSTKECFQRLTPSEREAVVRQKVQMLGLPEYLTSLAGLSNSLASLNPSAGNQLYDAIAECSKKEHFSSGAQTQQQEQHQPQQNIANLFLNRDDFMLNVQKQQHRQQQQQQPKPFANVPYGENSSSNITQGGNDEMAPNELINDFNLRMLLRGNNINASQPPTKAPTSEYGPNSSNLLAQQQLISSASQNSAMQMWMPQLTTANNVQQPQFMNQQHPSPANNDQWAGGNHVQLPSTAITGSTSMAGMGSAKATPASMWDALPLEPVHNQFNSNPLNFDLQGQVQSKLIQSQQINCTKDEHPQSEPFTDPKNDSANPQKVSSAHPQQVETIEKSDSPTKQVSRLHKEDHNEKQHQASTSKRSTNKVPTSQPYKKDTKEEGFTNKKQLEEDRRREIVEERRRQKDEKKRQQAEEEKRRLQLIEEEKQRQLVEEKERQHQIQSQRRKAMLGNSASNNSSSSAPTKPSKDQRIQSSIAPWSAQNIAIVSTSGPSLAEIQKAERRERRADQQRQMEILEKQMRANTAAAAEHSDSFLKWNASPVPVKSFAEIQAEEAKRLVAEQIESQRRKEQDHAATLVSNIVGGGGGVVGSSVSSSNNVSAIWSGSKVWGSTSNSGFWEEPIKFSTALATNNNSSISLNTGSANAVSKSQQKVQTSSSQQNNPMAVSFRNLTKSQTVSTMQNTGSLTSGSNKNNQNSNSAISAKPVQKQQQKSNADKKSGSAKTQNSHPPSSSCSASNKKDDYQNEFTSWCMKSLGGMNAKVDVPTFVTFLQDLESPYEVKDYVRMYLGESREYADFAKQFLERRSKYKNLQRAQNAHNDDMCKPAPAITPSGHDSVDNKGKQKKIKKNKMTKLDARILGFSVTAAEGRINVGDRDYVDGP